MTFEPQEDFELRAMKTALDLTYQSLTTKNDIEGVKTAPTEKPSRCFEILEGGK